MSDSYNVKLSEATLVARIAQISARFDDLSPMMLSIGETLRESTELRFSTSTAPDGSRWKPLAQATVLARLAEISGEFAEYTNLKTNKVGRLRVGDKKGYFDKTGRATKKSARIVANMVPLVETRALKKSFRYQLIKGGNGVEIGTDRFSGDWDGGAAIFHFGSRDGSIVPREILGVSASDQAAVLDIINAFGEQAIG